MITRAHVERLELSLREGGVAVVPTDTVYGLACHADDPTAVGRLYALKGRDQGKPAAVMFGSVEQALDALGRLEDRVRAAAGALLPGPVTLLVPDSTQRFVFASPGDPMTLGLRVPRFDGPLAAMAGLGMPLLQSSANPAGGQDPRCLDAVPEAIRAGADQVLDAGDLPGTPSTVLDLRAFAQGRWSIVRAGAMSEAAIGERLAGV